MDRIAKPLSMLLLCVVLLSLCGCGTQHKSYTYSEDHRVIVDTDTAADDAMALLLAAKAPNVDLLGVTVLAGNVSLEQGCENALMTLETAGRDDVPVYAGSDETFTGDMITPYSVFGADGMGDCGLIHPQGTPEEENGVDFIIETVKADPGEVEILALGPLTNIAKAIEKDPDTMKQVKHIWVMGTGGTSYTGNATPVAEFNVYNDVEAYDVVLGSGVPVTVAGCDVCESEGVLISEADLQKMAELGPCGAFLADALSLFAAERADENGCARVCDPVAAAAMIWSDFTDTSIPCRSEVITDDCAARGLVLFYEEGTDYSMVDEDDDFSTEVLCTLNDRDYLYNVFQLLK